MKKSSKSTIDKVSVISLGCAKNLVDSERLIGSLNANGFHYTEDLQNTDALIINTCGFINKAKEENIQTILQASQMKRQGLIKKLIVTGCLAERYESDLSHQLKDVDHVFGLNSNERILRVLNNDLKYILLGERLQLTPQHFAYLKISEGCNQKCSFCAIPLIRGKHQSYDIESMITETKNLVKHGTKEIVLIAQDSTYYGKDTSGERQLAELMDRISDIEGVEWLRLMYAYPRSFPTEVLDVIAKKSNICNYIDIPLQHASDKVLLDMKRGVTREKITGLIDTIRTKVPDVAIRSTFITGFPTETEKDFVELLDFITEIKLDRIGVFTYSLEEGTSAHPLGDPLPQKIKDQRREELMLAQQEISLQKNKSKIGNNYKVLVDEERDNKYYGRTEHDAPEVDNYVVFDKNNQIKVGDFVNIKINEASEYDLFGEIVN